MWIRDSVIIVIASAIITPTGDPFTLTVVAVPLYLLYELSILMKNALGARITRIE